MKRTKLLIAAACLAGTSAFAGEEIKAGENKMAPPSASDSKENVFYHAAIQFKPGSAMLNDEAKTKLRQLVRTVRANRAIEQVTVASWSDKKLLMKDASLTDTDRDLAKKRSEAIKDLVSMELGVTDVDIYNMAEPANWLARTFNTDEAELKSIFGRTAEETPVTREEFQLIKGAGAPGRAVVVAEYQHETGMTPIQTPDNP